MPDLMELMRVHVEVLFTHDPDRRLLRVNEPGDKPAPRFFLGRTASGNIWWFRRDVGDTLRRELEAAGLAEPPGEEFLQSPYGATMYEEALARDAPIERRWAGPAFRFSDALPPSPATVAVTAENADLLRPHLEAWLEDVVRCQPMRVTVIDGQGVAICCSGRTSNRAHEAAVETARAFREQGYATQAVSAWARAVRSEGRLPLYSTSWENTASLSLARRLGLVRFGSDLHFT
jgi:hypothetical protein